VDEALGKGVVYVSPDYRLLPTTDGEGVLSDILDAAAWAHEKLPAILAAEGFGSVDDSRFGAVGLSAGGWCAAAVTDYHKGGKTPFKALLAIYPEAGMDRPYYNQYRPNDPIMGILTPPPGEIIVRKKPILTGIDLPDFTKDREFYKAQGADGLWAWDQNTYCLHLIQYTGYVNELTGDAALSKAIGDSKSADERRKLIPEKFKKLFPQLNTTPNSPPTFIVHGEADNGVPFEDSVFWKSELDREGVKNVLVGVPGAYHGFEVGAVNDDSNETWAKYLKPVVLPYLETLLS